MNETDPISQPYGQEINTQPQRTFYGQIIGRPRIFTDKDGVGFVSFRAILEEKDGLHKRHVTAMGKDFVNYAHSFLKIGKKVVITGGYYTHFKNRSNGEKKREKRIRASDFRIL